MPEGIQAILLSPPHEITRRLDNLRSDSPSCLQLNKSDICQLILSINKVTARFLSLQGTQFFRSAEYKVTHSVLETFVTAIESEKNVHQERRS